MADRIRLYTDEHIPRAVVGGLRRRGVDVLSVPEAGMLGATDHEQLSFAQREGRVIFTMDDDFLRLHSEGDHHSGIIYVHQHGSSIGSMIQSLLLICEVLDDEDMVDHVEYL